MPVTLSDRAAKRIAEILKAEPQPTALRLAVTGGGCSGFQYNFALDDAQLDEDLVVEKGGAKVLIDPVSLDFLAGAEIDFTDDLIGQAFKVNNPNATASCGCGTSFHRLMKIATWNVNSVKARLEPALAWLKEAKPDVVCLQEINAGDENFPREPFEALGYNCAVHGQKSYNGVAILSKRPMEDVTPRLPGGDGDAIMRAISKR